jgi:O-antigen/teichoic acid export membrane protein
MQQLPANLRIKFLRSTTFNVSGQLAILIGNLIVTPIFLGYLGTEGYGLWALVLALSGTASGFDMGMSIGLTRSIPEYVIKKDYRFLSAITGAVIIFYLTLSIVALLLAMLFSPLLSGLFDSGLSSPEDAKKLFLYAAITLSFSNFAGIARAILQGMNRFDLNAILTSVTFVVFAVLGSSLLHEGVGLTGLVFAFCFMFFLQIIGGLAIIHRLCPFIKPTPGLAFSRRAWLYLFRFGSRMQVSALSDIFKVQVPKLLAGAFFGPAAAGFYDLGNRIANTGWIIPGSLLPAIIPTASEAESRGDKAQLRNFFLKGSRWLLVVALPLGVALALFSREILFVWLGPGYEDVVFVLICLSLANVLHLLTGVGTFIGRGIARPGIEMRYQLLTLLLYITLGYALMILFGFRGIPLGVAFACVIGSVYFLYSFSRLMNIDLSAFIRQVFTMPVALLFPSLLLTIAGLYFMQSLMKPMNIIFVLGGLFSFLYLVSLAVYLWRSRVNDFKSVFSSIKAIL